MRRRYLSRRQEFHVQDIAFLTWQHTTFKYHNKIHHHVVLHEIDPLTHPAALNGTTYGINKPVSCTGRARQ